ncbi:uncharacterized protein KLLA0_F23221g [Kluyveromyces lactis]|uniref:KLLA0F23221p n=1 Tax=Kluyveromyces lactis (strain ATCC 8585 / CBS 2359 / DSM 70799 / NBRC 1267 / NRRL Y-1140 / WM37) TaxID=284590 RepID=Q6CIX5_KLULA|nr:uncharacterized protein KLLA0_F23221g [Kluyveromyces lactis]CAG98822.1 KLLA0F23221p [Kluyveromyces lactis]|eukprot:XP_456114.1 uncharacterized protein KLLA0_F23221g [Kluyveromyces lactis]
MTARPELNTLHSAATEPTIIHSNNESLNALDYTGNDDKSVALSNAISRTNSTGNKIPKKRKPRRMFTTPGRFQQQLAIPTSYLERKPTTKAEAKGFYYFVSCMKQGKIMLFDQTLDRIDQCYDTMWTWPGFSHGVDFYQSHKDAKVLGTFLQVLRCCFDTRSIVFLPLFPVGIVFYKREEDIPAVICLLLALMYFAKLLSNTTEYASEHFGPVFGSLLNATFGNLVELIISGTTVSKDDAILTITSLIGSVISNNLLVIGSCFFFGGLDGVIMHSKAAIANHLFFLSSVTMALSLTSVIAVIDSGKSLRFKMDTSQIGAALIFLCYIIYLIVSTNQEFKALSSKKLKERSLKESDIETLPELDSDSDFEFSVGDKKDDEEKDLPPKLVCFITLAIATAGLGPTANFFVESLKELTDDKPISKVFIGLIILPLAGSLPEHISSLISAHHGQMDLAVSLAIGSSNQVLGMVLPIVQLISSRYPRTGFTLYFEPYVAGYLFSSTFVCCFTLIHGLLFSVNILHGTLLLATFGFIIYLTFAN